MFICVRIAADAAHFLFVVQRNADENIGQETGILIGFAISARHTVILKCVRTVGEVDGIEIDLNGRQ